MLAAGRLGIGKSRQGQVQYAQFTCAGCWNSCIGAQQERKAFMSRLDISAAARRHRCTTGRGVLSLPIARMESCYLVHASLLLWRDTRNSVITTGWAYGVFSQTLSGNWRQVLSWPRDTTLYVSKSGRSAHGFFDRPTITMICNLFNYKENGDL
jgi:hypothetical protein